MDTTMNVEEIFNNSLAHLGNEAKRKLIEMLAASMNFNDTKQEDEQLFNEICGAWSKDGLTAEEEIESD